jgi:uncharacterized membrane protein YozB (DUF420 family)
VNGLKLLQISFLVDTATVLTDSVGAMHTVITCLAATIIVRSGSMSAILQGVQMISGARLRSHHIYMSAASLCTSSLFSEALAQ